MKTSSLSTLNRRDFLKVLGATGVVAVGGHMLHTFTPWLDYEGQVSMNKQKFDNNPSNQKQQADADVKKLRSSSGVVNIASENDDKSTWVRTGQVYERLTLMMTSLNIKSALLNQPIEVPEIHPQFQTAMNLGVYYPQLLVRFGYAQAMPNSIRRPVEQILV